MRELRPGECPRCGWRGWYEGEDGDLYCEELGCQHAIRVKRKDDELDAANEEALKAQGGVA